MDVSRRIKRRAEWGTQGARHHAPGHEAAAFARIVVTHAAPGAIASGLVAVPTQGVWPGRAFLILARRTSVPRVTQTSNLNDGGGKYKRE